LKLCVYHLRLRQEIRFLFLKFPQNTRIKSNKAAGNDKDRRKHKVRRK